MGILKYILKRLVTLIPVLFGITILAFVLGICSPGDPVEAILNPDGTQIVREEDYKIVRERLGCKMAEKCSDRRFWKIVLFQ